jgi:hypothetical protein
MPAKDRYRLGAIERMAPTRDQCTDYQSWPASKWLDE